MSYDHFTELMDDTRVFLNRMREFIKFQNEFNAKWVALAQEIDDATPEQKRAFEAIEKELKEITDGV